MAYNRAVSDCLMKTNKIKEDNMKTTQARSFSEAVIVKLYDATPDPRGFTESVLGFCGLADKWIRISAADQRRYFGRVPFGKCALKISDAGVIRLMKTKAFGRDWDYIDFVLDTSKGTFLSAFDGSEIKTPANI